jgi:hypothetical protein
LVPVVPKLFCILLNLTQGFYKLESSCVTSVLEVVQAPGQTTKNPLGTHARKKTNCNRSAWSWGLIQAGLQTIAANEMSFSLASSMACGIPPKLKTLNHHFHNVGLF